MVRRTWTRSIPSRSWRATAAGRLPVEKRPRVLSFPNRMGNLVGSPFAFRQHGESGIWMSSLFPHLAERADDLCVINSMHCSNSRHGGAVLEWHTGSDTFVRPSMGSWITYGLGSENQNFPGYVTICQDLAQGGANNFGSGFLPAVYQGTTLGHSGTKPQEARIPFIGDGSGSPRPAAARARPDRARWTAARPRSAGPTIELDARIASFELAFRLQTRGARNAGHLGRVAGHAASVRPRRSHDGRLRHAVPAGAAVRRSGACASCNATSAAGMPTTTCKADHGQLARAVDKPIAGLLTDLKQRGLWDDTLVVWGGEFGRTPTCEGTDGRDHNPHGYTMWLAGGGVKAGPHLGQDRRLRLFRRRRQGPRPRLARHDPSSAGARPQAADLPIRGPRLPPDRRPRRTRRREFSREAPARHQALSTDQTRREFLAAAGGSTLAAPSPSRLALAGDAAARRLDAAQPATIPPHRPMTVEGVHAYTDRVSVAAGETIRFHVSSSIPYELQVCRLGTDVDGPARDEILHSFGRSPRGHPADPPRLVSAWSRSHSMPGRCLPGLTLEIWISRWRTDRAAGDHQPVRRAASLRFRLVCQRGRIARLLSRRRRRASSRQNLHTTPPDQLRMEVNPQGL